MHRTQVTSKGQVTVPYALREQLGIQSGDILEFRLEKGGLRVEVQKKRKASELRGRLRSSIPAGSKTQERDAVAHSLADARAGQSS